MGAFLNVRCCILAGEMEQHTVQKEDIWERYSFPLRDSFTHAQPTILNICHLDGWGKTVQDLND